MATRTCIRCGIEKEVNEFPFRSVRSDIRQAYCKDCRKLYSSDWYQKNKEYQIANSKKHRIEHRDIAREYIWKYLLEHPCVVCGESDPVVLEFHHLGGKDKEVSTMVAGGYPLPAIQAEVKKCQVMCSNCHRRLTAKERGWFRGG